MSKRLSLTCFLVSLVYLALTSVSAEELVRSYVEDFSTMQYCDTVKTTAWWDTLAGEVKLWPFEITLAGSCDTPGSAVGVAISGFYAYVADGTSGLQVIDIRLGYVARAGSCDTPGSASGVAISGDYAYVADGASGLQVIDISDPEFPTLEGSCDTPGYASGVAISGDYAYVTDGASGLQVIDISNPGLPVFEGSCDTPGSASGVAISGDYAYVADGTSGLQVIDISDPEFPTLEGSCDTPGYASGVAISGDYVYVADEVWGLQVIDVSDPEFPTLEGSCDTPGSAWGIALSGDYAYVSDDESGLQVIDISDPEFPTLEGSYDTPGYAIGVAVLDYYAYVADDLSGLQVLKVSNPAIPTIAGSQDTPGLALRVAISGDYAYVADEVSGLQVIDISNPASPMLEGSCDTPGSASGVAISGDYAYVADGDSGLQVIDISNPASPMLEGSCDTYGSASGVAISGDYAYVADWVWGLRVVDVSDPEFPTLAGGCDTPGYAWGVAISGDYAYVADGTSGLQVIDISDPEFPTLEGSCDTPGYAWGVAISGDYAYIADDSGLQVIDISYREFPTLAGRWEPLDEAVGVAVSHDYAYVADGWSGLQMIKIDDPWDPGLVNTCELHASARDVVISGDYAYVASWSGLQVIEAFQRQYDPLSNIAQSLTIYEADEMIVGACLNATYSDSIRWGLIVSGDGGPTLNWFVPGVYQLFPAPGTNLLWKSFHFYRGGDINPACSSLQIEWRYSFAIVDSIVDIPNDQGGQVRITWTKSGYDGAGSPTPITEYALFRRIDQVQTSAVSALGRKGRAVNTESSMGDPQGLVTYPPGDWDFVKTVPAYCEDSYSTVVPTLVDSTQSGGVKYSVFLVRAGTATPSVYFDSYPDSGYSVDNLAPAPPPGLMMASATDLAWDECPDDDFNYFTVYGSATPGLDSSAVLVGYTIDTAMDVTGDQYDYYHVTATDFAGNEGDASSVENTYAGVSRVEDLPVAFALKPNRPNPFESSTMIGFDLPEPCRVHLEVVDVQGRVVRGLTDEAWPAGRHSVVWTGENDTGRDLGPGVYFVRIQAGQFTARNKMLRIR